MTGIKTQLDRWSTQTCDGTTVCWQIDEDGSLSLQINRLGSSDWQVVSLTESNLSWLIADAQQLAQRNADVRMQPAAKP